MSAAYQDVISAAANERLDLFLTTANRLGTPIGNVEKDFWVCWTLNALYHERPASGPRLLFKGGTSLSKAHGLIERFSEDIDVTVFRDDLDESASVEELEALSNKKRRARLEAIRDACRAYITGSLRDFLTARLADVTKGAGRVEIDEADPDGQTLLVWYPEVEPRDGAYVRPAVRDRVWREVGTRSEPSRNDPALCRRRCREPRSCHCGRHDDRCRAHLLGQGRHRAWLAPLVRASRRAATGGTAGVPSFL